MWDPRTPAVGEQAADLTFFDEQGRGMRLSGLGGPLLLLLFRSPDDETGLRLLRDYRDYTLALGRQGVSIYGVAQADPSTLAYLRRERGLGFPLLADPGGDGLDHWGLRDTVALLLLDGERRVVQRALGERAPADKMLAFVRRGRLNARPSRLAQFFHALHHALRPRRRATSP
jgi:peroxiredoxin